MTKPLYVGVLGPCFSAAVSQKYILDYRGAAHATIIFT
jgi:hypothetical protein